MTKKSENVVVHFYRDETFRCKILDKHLNILAAKHVETKICKINAEKCPFLTSRLSIKVIPTMAVIKDGITKDYIVGFTELGNTDEFSTEMLEWKLGCADVINYQGDLMNPPDGSGKKAAGKTKVNILSGGQSKKKTVRGRDDDDSSDNEDW